jgi:hypothetical protein
VKISILLLTIGAAGTAGAEAPRALFIEGYAGAVSYAPGEEAGLHVSTSAESFSVEVARLGASREVVWQKSGLPGREHPVPEAASANGCGWPESARVKIPDTWRSGYYTVKLSAEDRGGTWIGRGRRTAESECFFIVRPAVPGRDTRLLIELSTNTYNAYNNWGGFSLYAYNGLANNQGHRVSFHRPPSSQFGNWEAPFVAWAEKNGLRLDYCANSDIEFHAELLDPGRYSLVLSVGHDEYWSAPMRDNLERFIARGGNVAFFSGNTCCWQVRSDLAPPERGGGLALVCWKQNFSQDPQWQTGDHRTLTTLWSHWRVGRPENQLTGVGFLWGGYHKSHGQFMDGDGAFAVHRPEHWVFEGTGLAEGAKFGGKDTIVGYECDGCELVTGDDRRPRPTHRDGTPEGFEILATAPARWHPDDCEWYDRWEKGRQGHAVVGIYRKQNPDGTRGGTVITSGTTDWSHGLRGGDAVVERITRNIIGRLGKPEPK